MIAVQTFWTPPTPDFSAMKGGWLDFRFHMMSWALSSALLKEHFPKLVLHTDNLGKQLLIDWLALPYDEVQLSQQGLATRYDAQVWVMRKIHTYALMDVPFCHVDSDAFLWQPLSQRLTHAPVLVQNFQQNFACYRMVLSQLEEAGIPPPPGVRKGEMHYQAVNMGVVGGTALHAFQDFYTRMQGYVDKVMPRFRRHATVLKKGFLNTLLEECAFYYHLAERQLTIQPLLSQDFNGNYIALKNVWDQRHGYSHLIGDSKRSLFCCQQLESQMKVQFPALYKQVIQVIHRLQKKRVYQKILAMSADPFAESNTWLKAQGQRQRITTENYKQWSLQEEQEGSVHLAEALHFEQSKYELGQKKWQAYRAGLDPQPQRFLLWQQHLALRPMEQRWQDSIQHNAEEPLLHRSYLGPDTRRKHVYVSLLYEFRFGWHHLDHKVWDTLSLLILLKAEETLTLQKLVHSLLQREKLARAQDKQAMKHRIDLSVQALFLAGLLDYRPCHQKAVPPNPLLIDS